MTFLAPYEPQLRSLLRIVGGLLFLHFGIAKLLHFPVVPMFATVSPTDWPEGYAGMVELVTGALMLLGFFSRIGAFIASGEMALGYFIAHLPKSIFPAINDGSLAIMFCFTFLYLAAAGPGPWAINQK